MSAVLETIKCVVYNASYEIIDFTSAKRAFVLTLKDKATTTEVHPTLTFDVNGRTYEVPTGIRLHTMVKVFRGPAQLTQGNLFLRDNFTCQYCGRSRGELKDKEQLTREHIIPRDKGGKDIWKNVTTACNKCNNKKANRFLKDCPDLHLRSEPYTPTVAELRVRKLSRLRKRY